MSAELDIKRVLISDDVDNQCVEILKASGIDAVKQTKLSKDQLKVEIAKYDGLIVRSATKVTADVIEAGSRLKVIGRAGTGVDNIDVPTATRHGIIVMNTPGGNTLSAAEHTCALLMAVSRHVSSGTACIRAGQWDQKKMMIGNELYGKTLAILGLGRIGREVAYRMQSFGMKTIGFDPLMTAEDSRKFGVEFVQIDELWPLADYITIHTPLVPQTKHLINSNTLAKCRKGVRIVNCARGGIINEDDLLEAIKSGKCAGAGLDVFEQEPPTGTSALLQHPLVTSTPHLGASTVEAQSRVAVEIAQGFVDLVQRKSLTGAINADAFRLAMSADTKPWLQLAKSLAKLGRVFLSGTLTAASSLSITTRGDLPDSAGVSLAAASLTELLSSAVDQSTPPLNLVSAPALAKASGIEIRTTHEGARDKSTAASLTLTVVLQTDGGRPESVGRPQWKPLNSIALTGTVMGGQIYWNGVDGAKFWQPLVLTGSLLICRGSNTSKAATCLSSVNDYIATLKSVEVLSFTSTEVTSSEQSLWSVIRLTSPIEPELPASAACSTSVQITL